MSSPESSLVSRATAGLQGVVYHLWTALLFTKNDIKSTMVPITVFALGSAPTCPSGMDTSTHSVAAVVWLWTALLHFNLINQTDFLEEDVRNKPWRPIPSNRISLENAVIARWLSVPVCALLSTYLGGAPLLALFAVYTTLVLLYNRYGGAKVGFLKNTMTALGLCCAAMGTKLVAEYQPPASGSAFQTLQFTTFPELVILFFVISTTTHAQDFEDVEGDREIGRRTVPIICPELSRIAMPASLIAWSVGIAAFVNAPAWLAAAYVGLAIIVGFRFAVMRRVEDDKRSCFLYAVWLGLTVVHLCLSKRQGHCDTNSAKGFPYLLTQSVLNSSEVLGY